MTPHIETVQAIYQAFGRGDVPALLAGLSPQVQWEAWADNSAQRAGAATMQPRQGHEGVQAFLGEVARQQIHEFKVLDIFGSGHQVVAEVVIDLSYADTGRRIRDEELHLWTFGPDGKVMRMRHYTDTAKHMWGAGVAQPQ